MSGQRAPTGKEEHQRSTTQMATRNVIAFIEGRPLITPVGRITAAAMHEGAT